MTQDIADAAMVLVLSFAAASSLHNYAEHRRVPFLWAAIYCLAVMLWVIVR